MFTKEANQTVIKDIYLPLPDFMRSADHERLLRALRFRGEVRGELNPIIFKKQGETQEEYFSRYRKLTNVSHRFDNFRLTDKGIKANLTFLDPTLIEFSGVIQLVRRAFNDYWRLGEQNSNAPGFFGVDVVTLTD